MCERTARRTIVPWHGGRMGRAPSLCLPYVGSGGWLLFIADLPLLPRTLGILLF